MLPRKRRRRSSSNEENWATRKNPQNRRKTMGRMRNPRAWGVWEESFTDRDVSPNDYRLRMELRCEGKSIKMLGIWLCVEYGKIHMRSRRRNV